MDEIAEAIRCRLVIEIDYDPGLRTIEPHACGYSADGNPLLRAWQTGGASASGKHVNWKLFRVDRIRALQMTTTHFDGPRPDYRRDDSAMKGGVVEQL